MSGEVDTGKIRQWAHEKPPTFARIKNRFWRMWYHRIKTLPEGRLRIRGIFRGLFKVVALLGIFAAPYWTEFFKKNPAYSSSQLAYMTAALAGLLFVSWLMDTFSFARRTEQRKRSHLERFASLHRVTIDEIQEFIHFDEESQDQRLRLTENVLSCILELVKGQIGEYEARYFEVSLLVFDDERGNFMKVFARTSRGRRRGVSFKSENSLAYHAAVADTTMAAHDMWAMKGVPKQGLSESNMPYRSALFVPISVDAEDSSDILCKGVVSVDSSRPYEFGGSVGYDVEVQMMPFVRLLAVLLQHHGHALPVSGGVNDG